MKAIEALTNFVTQGHEAIQEIKKAKSDDGKIKRFEWVGVIRELKDVVKAVKDLKGVNFADTNDSDLMNLSNLIMDCIEKEVKFDRNDVYELLNIARSIVKLTSDNK
jgi:hypothetical protein